MIESFYDPCGIQLQDTPGSAAPGSMARFASSSILPPASAPATHHQQHRQAVGGAALGQAMASRVAGIPETMGAAGIAGGSTSSYAAQQNGHMSHRAAAAGQNGDIIIPVVSEAIVPPNNGPLRYPPAYSTSMAGRAHNGANPAAGAAAAWGAENQHQGRPAAAVGADANGGRNMAVEMRHPGAAVNARQDGSHVSGHASSPASEGGSLSLPGGGGPSVAAGVGANGHHNEGVSAASRHPSGGIVITGPAVPSRLPALAGGHGVIMDLGQAGPPSSARNAMQMQGRAGAGAGAAGAADPRPMPGQAAPDLNELESVLPMIRDITLPLAAIKWCASTSDDICLTVTSGKAL